MEFRETTQVEDTSFVVPITTSNVIVRKKLNSFWVVFLGILSAVSIVILMATVLTMISYGIDFITTGRIIEVVTKNEWETQDSINEGSYGALAMIWGTFFMAVPTILLSIFWGVGSAIVLSEYIPQSFARKIQPVIEFIAAIPTVIMGLIAFEFVSAGIKTVFGHYWFRFVTGLLGFRDGNGIPVTSGRGFLAAIITVSLIASPIIVSISYDAMQSTPAMQRQAAKAFGATRIEVFNAVVLPHSKKSIFASTLLAFGRIAGETMVVLMVLGSSPVITWNLFSPGYTLTAAIAGEYGDAAFYSAEFRVLFILGLILLINSFIVIWIAGMIERENPTFMRLINFLYTPVAKIEEVITEFKQNYAEKKDLDKININDRIELRRQTDSRKYGSYATIMIVFMGLTFSLLGIMLGHGFSYFIREGVLKIIPRFWEFISTVPTPDARNVGDYGIKQAIGGSISIVGLACLFAFPISTAAGVFLYEFAGDNSATRMIRNSIINISAIPSIVVGLFVYGAISIGLGWERGVLPGAIALGIMMIPIVTTNTIEAMRNVPDTHRVSAVALGSTNWEAVKEHKLPYAFPSIITGYILAIARVIGETAPLLFIAGSFVYGSEGFFPDRLIQEPVRVMPFEIYYNLLFEIKTVAINGIQTKMGPEWAMATAFVLLIIVVILNIAAYYIRKLIRRRYEYNGNI